MHLRIKYLQICIRRCPHLLCCRIIGSNCSAKIAHSYSFFSLLRHICTESRPTCCSCGERGMDPIRRQQKNVWVSSTLFPLRSEAVNKYRRYQFLKSYTTARGVCGAYTSYWYHISYDLITPPEHRTIKCFSMIWVHQPAIHKVE